MQTLPCVARCNSGAARLLEGKRETTSGEPAAASIVAAGENARYYGGVIPDAALNRYGSVPPPSRYMLWQVLHVGATAPAAVCAFI